MKRKIFVFLFICLSANVFGQEKTTPFFKHYYYRIDKENVDEFKYEFGEIVYDKKGEPTCKPLHKDSAKAKNILFKRLEENLKTAPLDRNDVLVYIHGMWGHLEDYFQMNTRVMRNKLYMNERSEAGIAISLIWDSKTNYQKNVSIAKAKGKEFAPFIEELIGLKKSVKRKKDRSQLNFICHSMGNTVFESAYKLLNKNSYSKPPIDCLIHAASDQNGDVYMPEGSLAEIEKMVDQVYIYMHNDDRTLRLSKLAEKHSRMGLDGLHERSLAPSNVHIVDVSMVNDDEDMISRFSKHRYFYSSEIIRQDILSVLKRLDPDKIPNRKYMAKKDAYKLLFPESN